MAGAMLSPRILRYLLTPTYFTYVCTYTLLYGISDLARIACSLRAHAVDDDERGQRARHNVSDGDSSHHNDAFDPQSRIGIDPPSSVGSHRAQ